MTGRLAAKPGLRHLHWVVEAHWLGRWRSPRLLKLWRYGAGSIVAFVTSVVVVYICYSWADFGAITSTVIGFVAGAVPNWILNRRWAWKMSSREGMGKETALYVAVSAISLVASSAADKLTARASVGLRSDMERDLLVTAAYVVSTLVLTALKYLAYDRWVFVDRRRSRNQVPTTTEQNLVP